MNVMSTYVYAFSNEGALLNKLVNLTSCHSVAVVEFQDIETGGGAMITCPTGFWGIKADNDWITTRIDNKQRVWEILDGLHNGGIPAKTIHRFNSQGKHDD